MQILVKFLQRFTRITRIIEKSRGESSAHVQLARRGISQNHAFSLAAGHLPSMHSSCDPLSQFLSSCVPGPPRSSWRDHQGAPTLHKSGKGYSNSGIAVKEVIAVPFGLLRRGLLVQVGANEPAKNDFVQAVCLDGTYTNCGCLYIQSVWML